MNEYRYNTEQRVPWQRWLQHDKGVASSPRIAFKFKGVERSSNSETLAILKNPATAQLLIAANMSSSKETQTLGNETPTQASSPSSNGRIPEEKGPDSSDQTKSSNIAEEEEEECGFCLFMKGGECRDSFIAWEKCVQDLEKDKGNDVKLSKCIELVGLLKTCMEQHADYYSPVFRAEKAAAEQEPVKESEGDKAA